MTSERYVSTPAIREAVKGRETEVLETQEEIDAGIHRADSVAELAEIERTCPLAVMESMTLAYRNTRSGRIMVHKHVGDDREGEDVWLPVATPFGVPARVRHADLANAYGLSMTVQDMDGRPGAIEFDRATLPRMAAAEIRAQQFAVGLRTEVDGEMVAVQALKAANLSREIILVSHPGWHCIPELSDLVFVTPEGDALGALDGCMLELAAAARLPGFARTGSLEGWHAALAAAVLATNCPHWILAAAGFGWRVWELFGCCRRAVWGSIQGMGLLLLLRGDEIAALTATEAAIRTRTGTRQTYLRKARDPLHTAEWCLVRKLS